MTGREWRQLGLTLYASANYHSAIAAFLRARDEGENDAEFHRELAYAFWGANDREHAIKEIHAAQELDKGSYNIAFAIATFLASEGDMRGAVKWLSHAVELKPDEHQARFNRALYLLSTGDWERGWKEYDARFDLYSLDFPRSDIPLWKGNASIDGKLVWVTCEQGQGDQIQFSRYVPWLRAQGAHIIFDSHAELVDFSFAGDVMTRSTGAGGAWKIPELDGRRPDYVVPLMSLASRHRTTQSNVPPQADWYKKVARQFKVNIGGTGKKKIGLVWKGSDNHPNDKIRSIPLETLLPLTGDARFDWFSFQVGKSALDLQRLGAEPLLKNALKLAHWPATVAAMSELDALITIDSAPAHMAASLGLKTFMLVATEPDWRWGMTGETTPWYPSMRIMRQERRGDWSAPLRRVVEEIARL